MPKMEGIKQLKAQLKRLEGEARKKHEGSVIVGFTQNYAIYVHENLEAAHDPGQAKFLEQPAREKAKELGKIIATVAKRTGSVKKGLLLAGLRLQAEAQKLVPVDTGALKASGFVALQENATATAALAFKKSEAIRKKKK